MFDSSPEVKIQWIPLMENRSTIAQTRKEIAELKELIKNK